MEKDEQVTSANTPEEVNTPPTRIPFSETDVSTRYDDVYQVCKPDMVTLVQWKNDAYEFYTENGMGLRVQVLNDAIVRFRYSADGEWARDFSYAVNPDFRPDNPPLEITETGSEFVIDSPALQIVVSRQGMQVRVYDQDDRLILEDAAGFEASRTVMEGWNQLAVSKVCNRKSLFYGLGDKACDGANLHGKKFENWCTDSYAFGADTDPLYRAIPFFYFVQNGVATGIFTDNTFRTFADFNVNDEGSFRFGAAGGELNFYLLYGPDLTNVAVRYHQLTGTHAMPPMWALGYHQCKWSYFPDTQVLKIAEQFRKENIPCDAIYLDIDYMDGYRCFTWNKKYFPSPKKLIDELRKISFHTVVMIDPGIKEDRNYSIYMEGLKKGYFLRNTDGSLAKAPVWPGFCAFPDFTRPEVREWWGALYEELYVENGVSGFWNDMNEPAVFFVNHKTLPDSVMHDFDGDPGGHRKAHNIYGQQMTRATVNGLDKMRPGKRPFLLTRASFSGGQRFAAVWTGDNCASWEHLQMANVQCQRLSISGFSFCGTDIGGFAGDPDGELYTRWLQLSVFHPLMRTHSMGGHHSGDAITEEPIVEGESEAYATVVSDDLPDPRSREPWAFGEKWTPVARTAIELRYCMLPSIYTAFWQLTTKGIPMLRHASFAAMDDMKLWNEDRDFLFGEHLFVSPVIQPKIQRQMVSLPKGNWFYFWSGHQCSGEVFVNVAADQIPFFVREGAVMVTYPVRQHTAEPIEEITLYCYHKIGSTESTFYEDDGDGMGYLDGNYALNSFLTDGDTTNYTLKRLKTGNWSPVSRKIKIYLIGFPTFAKQCLVDNVEMPVKEIRLRDRTIYSVTVDTEFELVSWHA